MTTSTPEEPPTQFDIDVSLLSRREKLTQRRVAGITVLGTVIIAIGVMLFSYTAYLASSNRRDAVQAMKLVVESSVASREASLSAASAANQAQRLAEQLQRSTPVIAISPDRKWSVSRSGWMVDVNGAPVARVAESAAAATFSPDSLYLFVSPLASPEASVLIRVDQTGTGVMHFPSGFGNEPGFVVSSAMFSQDSSTLTLLSVTGTAELFDIRTSAVISKARNLSIPLAFAAFSRNARLVVGVSVDGKALLCDLSARQPDGSLPGCDSPTARTRMLAYDAKGVFAAAFEDSAQNRVMLAYQDGTVRVFDVTSGDIVNIFDGFGEVRTDRQRN